MRNKYFWNLEEAPDIIDNCTTINKKINARKNGLTWFCRKGEDPTGSLEEELALAPPPVEEGPNPAESWEKLALGSTKFCGSKPL